MNPTKVIGKGGKFNIGFRGEQLTSHAGVVRIKELAERLGVAQILDEELTLKGRERGDSEGAAVGNLVYNLILGGTCLRGLEGLRGDRGTQELLAMATVLAPTTAGEFLREVDIGDVRDLQRVTLRLQQQVRSYQQATACPLDVDSSIYEQASTHKEGSTKAYKGEIGSHPLSAFWAEEGELLFSHRRRGSAPTARNAVWFLRETRKRIPSGLALKLRAGSGFYSPGGVGWGEHEQVVFGISADQAAPLLAAITALPERRWTSVPEYELAEVAELRSQPTGWQRPYRYLLKREVAERPDGELDWKCPALVTNEEAGSARAVLIWQLQHAGAENQSKEHQSGFGWEKLPTQQFPANWAYLLMGQIAFNLVAWFKTLVLPASYRRATTKTIRYHLLHLAGKIVHTGRRLFVIISDQYRYQAVWRFAIERLANL